MLYDENVFFVRWVERRCPHPETTGSSPPGFQQHGTACICPGGGVSILVCEGQRAEAGPALVAGIGLAQASSHPEAGIKLTVSSAHLLPSPAKSMKVEESDGLLCADGPQLMGADTNAHSEAWDRSIPSGSRGDTVAQRCENVSQVVNIGERKRYTKQQGS
ncbi:hypothetical protein C3747_194g21 [Trypanosoma cruzi]|uniref:Uncharacterized protein n=1 Tax=Trypanosoma cruzi TaxID=5693 RepID=A0A2V2VZA9_TRYCR|nr:hypothetical protein C3747_194g21 [Trypanosoma cruzi]RNC55003.1 Tbingi protein [Trypanosoma cruzi]